MTLDAEAPGAPGIGPRWTTSSKVGVGTAMSQASRLWFTISHGIVNELYFPRVDIANTRDAGFLVASDGFFSEEKRDTRHEITQLDPWAPAFRLTNSCLQDRYQITKEVITDPERGVLVQRLQFAPRLGPLQSYRVFFLIAPHLLNHGFGNFAWLDDYQGLPMLFARRQSTFMAVACSTGFSARSVGFVGVSDGWQDISQHHQLTWRYTHASDGNVAMTGQLALPTNGEATVAVAFGRSPGEAAQQARATLIKGFDRCLDEYVEGWRQATKGLRDLSAHSGDDGRLARSSALVLLSHMDKSMPGATVASLSIPWGEARDDGDIGGYHLVWARDLVEGATARLAIADSDRAWQTFLYLASIQSDGGSWPQNNWLDGEPYWRGVQLDETAFPVLLAYRLRETAADRAVDLWPIVRKAAAFLARTGPVTQEERWEEDGGYSPSTLATCIAALVCAAAFARAAGEPELGAYLEEVADWWAGQLDFWTFTCEGDLVPGHPEHYVRLGVPQDGRDDGRRSNGATVVIHNLSPGAVAEFPTRDVVDTGFLELVRHGVRPANDRSVVVSLPVVDATLKVELPCGPCWHRYNHDGYGEREDGSPFVGWGSGRPWPLLTGERAHYELAAGNVSEARRLARAMECFANDGGLLSEQVWDGPDNPDRELTTGRPSGSATPLLWAHAEYLKLLRSLADGQVFDLLAPVANRYKGGPPRARAVWRFNHKLRTVARGGQLRIEVLAPALVHWSADQWQNVRDAPAIDSTIGLWYVDLPASATAEPRMIVFTFLWTDGQRWEGEDYAVEVQS